MPLSDALAGGVGMNTTAYSLLQNIASKSKKHGGSGTSSKKRSHQHNDNDSSSSSSSKKKTTPNGWMKVDKLDPDR